MIDIGRKDRIDLPELELFDLEAKIDTGAYGCSLHCHHIHVVNINDSDVLSFKLLDPSHKDYLGKTFYIENFGRRNIKNSGGTVEQRYTIKTKLVIFNEKKVVEFSLTDRQEMKYPVLLGRKFLAKKYHVKVELTDLSYNAKREMDTEKIKAVKRKKAKSK